jgi:hypothetical protein
MSLVGNGAEQDLMYQPADSCENDLSSFEDFHGYIFQEFEASRACQLWFLQQRH